MAHFIGSQWVPLFINQSERHVCYFFLHRVTLGADHLGVGGLFLVIKNFFFLQSGGQDIFFTFFPISFLLHLCCMQFFSSDKRLQEFFFQNHPLPPQEIKGRPLKTAFLLAIHKREIFSCVSLVGKWLLVMIFIYDLYSRKTILKHFFMIMVA